MQTKPTITLLLTCCAVVAVLFQARAASAQPQRIHTGPDSAADGYLDVAPDEYGSWAVPFSGGQGPNDDHFNPAGPLPLQQAAFTSGFFLFVPGATQRELLSGNADWQAVFPADTSLQRQVTSPNAASDTNGDGLDDRLESAFRVFGGSTDLVFELVQQVSTVSPGVSVLEQQYTVTNVSALPVSATMVRAFDGDLLWSGDFSNDEVGTTRHAEGIGPYVFQQEPDAPAITAVTVFGGAGGGPYYGGKHGVLPAGGAPPYDFGTDTEVWDAYGVPTSWQNHIAGVGYNTDGVSGPAPPGSTDPEDAFIGLRFDLDLAPQASTTITVSHTYGQSTPAPQGENIPANSTLFVTVGTSSYFPFSERPVPPDFFFPGSPPLTDDVPVQGVPLGTYQQFCVGPTDTIIAQLEEAVLGGPGTSDTVDMQLAALSLGSVSPITVGGTQWNVHMGLSPTMPTLGTMTITQTSPDGGVWEGVLEIFVAATFTEVGNPANVLVLDTGDQPPLISETTGPMPWSFDTPPEYAVVPGLTANFFTAGHEHTKKGHAEMAATLAFEETGNIPPNSTLFVTVGTSSYFPFSERPVPPDFFFPGSPPLTQDVPVQSVPLGTYKGFFVGPTDTIIAQLEEAVLGGPGTSDTVAMQLAALSLGSVAPITVGNTQWNVHMGLSPTMPTLGTMTITQTCPDGGEWEGLLEIFVAATFTEVGNPANVLVLDTGDQPPLISETTGPMPWSFVTPPQYAVVPGLTANFFTAGHEHTKKGHAEMAATLALNPCPADVTGDGEVSVSDLVEVILNWGECAPNCGPSDTNFDGTIDVLDLVGVILAWGPCELP